jgi:hypothetical protein
MERRGERIAARDDAPLGAHAAAGIPVDWEIGVALGDAHAWAHRASSNTFGGTLGASVFYYSVENGERAAGRAESSVRIVFDVVDHPERIVLDTTLPFMLAGDARQYLTIEVESPNADGAWEIVAGECRIPSSDAPTPWSATLAPGEYRLTVTAQAHASVLEASDWFIPGPAPGGTFMVRLGDSAAVEKGRAAVAVKSAERAVRCTKDVCVMSDLEE